MESLGFVPLLLFALVLILLILGFALYKFIKS